MEQHIKHMRNQRLEIVIRNEQKELAEIEERIKNIMSIKEFRRIDFLPEMIDNILSFLPRENVEATDFDLELLRGRRFNLTQSINRNIQSLQSARERTIRMQAAERKRRKSGIFFRS